MWPVIIILVFAIALAARPMHGDGWYWEVGNGVGFLALALLLVLVLNGRGGLGRSFHHRWLSIAVFIAVFTHSLWFLLGDSTTWEYLKWGAPHYMVAGLFSAALILIVTATSLVSLRNSSYTAYKPFRNWHRWLSIAILISALFHVIPSGFYIVHPWQVILLTGLALVVYFLPTWLSVDTSFQRRNTALVSAAVVTIYGLLRMGVAL